MDDYEIANGFSKMQEERNCSYLLSCEEDEKNLVKLLKNMSESLWLKYSFENLEDREDLKKVIFRMILAAARSEKDIFFKFSWANIELFHLQEDILKEANYEFIKCTVINFEKYRLLIMLEAKKYLDDNDYTQMLGTIFKHVVYCHDKPFYGIVYNNVDCLNFLWNYVTNDEKTVILGYLGIRYIQKLFWILPVKYLLEDKVILQFLKDRCELPVEYSDNFFLSDKKSEAILSDFLIPSNIKEPRKKLDSMWKKAFENNTVEDQRKSLLRLFLWNIKSPHNKVTEWAWEKSLNLKQHMYLLNGANGIVIKSFLEACHPATLQQFLCKAGNHLTRIELIEMLKEGIEYIVYWHGRVFDDEVENNLESFQIALNEFGKSLSMQVLKSLNKTTKIKQHAMLKYDRSKVVPEIGFSHYILTNKEAEKGLLNFLQAIKSKEEVSEESLDAEWNLRGLRNLSSRDLYSALFRAFIMSIGLINKILFYWILRKIKKYGHEIKLLKEQNYHFIKTVMDLSDVDLLNRALKFAKEYLEVDEMQCMFQEAYMHAVKWNGHFICGEVWDSTSSLQTLKQCCSYHQWKSIFKFNGQNLDDKTKRHFDGETGNSIEIKKVRYS